MFRLACLLIGCILGVLPVPPAPSASEDAPPGSRLALCREYWPVLTEAALTGGACLLGRLLFRRSGAVTALWAGLGVLLARLSPLRKEPGGAAAVYAFEIIFAPVWGILSCAAGVGVSVLSGREILGELLPAALFVLPADLFYGAEAGAVALIAILLLIARRWKDLVLLIEGVDSGIAPDDGEDEDTTE